MLAYAKAGDPERTEALYKEMATQGANLNKEYQPNEETLRLCLEAWALSGHPASGDAADRYLELLDRQYPNEKLYRLEMRYVHAIRAWENQHNKLVARPRKQMLNMKLKAIQQAKAMKREQE